MKTRECEMDDGEWNTRSAATVGTGRAGSPLPAARRLEGGAHGVTRPTLNGRRALFCLFILHSAFCLRAWGQYAIDWSTVDGGGGTSTNSQYSVTGTIGQPDASTTTMTSGQYSLTGGFWAICAVQTPGAPLLCIFRTTTNTVAVTWPSRSTGWNLQQNTNSVSSLNWSNITSGITDDGTTKTLVVNPPAGNRFYRMHQP